MIIENSEEIHITKGGHSVKTVLVKCQCGVINRRSKSSVARVPQYRCVKCSNKRLKNKHRIGVAPANKQFHCYVQCDWCGNLKTKRRRELEKTKHTFCNTKCQRKWQDKFTNFNKGKQNPAYKHGERIGGASSGYGSDFTSKLRRSTKIRDNYTCQHCNLKCSGNKGKYLDVHHIDENKYNNSIDNLICLCKSCHTKVHWARLEKGKK